MTTAKYDPEFEAQKKEMIEDGIRALSIQLGREDITKENLGNFLYSQDPETISRDCSETWQEFFDESVEEDADIKVLKYKKARTKLWLAEMGYKLFNEWYPNPEILSYLWNFQEWWGTIMTDLENDSERDFYKPSLLQWSLYLTVRKTPPEDLPPECMLTYAIKRWTEICQRVEFDVSEALSKEGRIQESEIPHLQDKFLKRRLRNLHTEAETYIAQEEGTYEVLKEKRKLERKVLAGGHTNGKVWLKEAYRLSQEGHTPEEIYQLLSPKEIPPEIVEKTMEIPVALKPEELVPTKGTKNGRPPMWID